MFHLFPRGNPAAIIKLITLFSSVQVDGFVIHKFVSRTTVNFDYRKSTTSRHVFLVPRAQTRLRLTTLATSISDAESTQPSEDFLYNNESAAPFKRMPPRIFKPVNASKASSSSSDEDGHGIRVVSYNVLGPWQALTDKHNYRFARSDRSENTTQYDPNATTQHPTAATTTQHPHDPPREAPARRRASAPTRLRARSSTEHRRWGYRRGLLLHELRGYAPDILCLQEVHAHVPRARARAQHARARPCAAR